MRLSHSCFAITLLLQGNATFAGEPLQHSLAQEPYTGLLKTPNALVADYGQAQLDYSNAIERKTSYVDGYNYMVTAGLFPGLELTGRIATQTNNCNLYIHSDCGIRDLSASAKYHLPFIPANWFDAAVGARDLGGAANNFQAYYGVLSKQWWQVRFSAGVGKSESRLGQLNGPFGGVEWQPVDWLQFIAEQDANSVNLGAKLFTPQQWSPAGWQAYTSVQTYQQENHAERNYWFGVGVKLPLWMGSKNVQPKQAIEPVASKELSDIALQEIKGPNANSANMNIQPASVVEPMSMASARQNKIDPVIAITDSQQLETALHQAGFENIQVAIIDKQLMVALENNRYNWNELDGLGVALGLMADKSPEQIQNLQLILLNQKLPVLSISASRACTKAYLQQSGHCDSGTPGFDVSTRNLNKQFDKLKSQSLVSNSAFRPRFVVAPAIRSNVATEYGVLDYSLGLSSNLQVPMWQGAMFDVRHFAPLSNSDDFDNGKIWAKNRYESDVDRVLIHQAFWLPADVFTKFSMGRMLFDYEGIQNESRWESEAGAHRFKLESAQFKNEKTHDTAQPVLGSYRYYNDSWDWAGELTVGRFWDDDKGYKLVSRHWFGDTEIRLFLRDTNQKIAGIEFAIPLTFRQDMKPTRFGQIRGTDQFAYGIETLVGNSHNRLTDGIGVTPSLTHNVDQVYFNRDRLNPSYVESHLTRLREAYQKYNVTESK